MTPGVPGTPSHGWTRDLSEVGASRPGRSRVTYFSPTCLHDFKLKYCRDNRDLRAIVTGDLRLCLAFTGHDNRDRDLWTAPIQKLNVELRVRRKAGISSWSFGLY